MDKGKSIAIVITGNINTDQRIIKIANLLQENKYRVTVFYRPYLKYNPLNSNNNSPTTNYSFKIVPIKSIINKGFLFYLIYNFILFFNILFKKYDILYAVDSDTLLGMVLLSKFKNKPLVYDAHEYFSEVPELEGQNFKKRIWNWITQWGVNCSKLRITVSETLALELNKKYHQKFETIRNVAIKKEEQQKNISNAPVILYQGALNKGRELHLLIKAMEVLKEFKCVIVGEGDLSVELRNLTQNMNLKNVEFLGLTSPNLLSNITNEAFVGYNLLEPSSLSYYFSLSNKYFDYMHARVPSLSSWLPEYELLNKELNCGICINNSVESIVENIIFLHTHKKEYQLMVENAIIASMKYNWQNESQKLLSLINKI